MSFTFDILPELIGYSMLMGFLYFSFYYRYIYSVIDPLFVFVITCVFGSVLVIETLDNPAWITSFFVCQLCVFLGFAIVQEKTGNPALQKKKVIYTSYSDTLLLRYVVYVLIIIYVVANIFLIYNKGLALFSDTPTADKVTNYQGGFGLFRKINLAVGGVASTGLTYLYLDKMRRRDLALLILMMFLGSLEGSKGALVRYVICFGLFLYHPAFRYRQDLFRRIRRLAPLAVVGVFGVFFTVLFKETNSTDEALLAFVRRLLYGADVVLYYYHPNNLDYFANFSPWSFPSYILNPILGLFRVTPYKEALGNIMVENALPPGLTIDVIVGPNSPFYTEGQIYFGYFGAFVYSFFVGAMTSYIRTLYFTIVKSSAFLLVFANTIALYSMSFLTDVRMTVSMLFDTSLFVIPIFLVTSLFVHNKITIRETQFSVLTKDHNA